jgi:hypothetical protein
MLYERIKLKKFPKLTDVERILTRARQFVDEAAVGIHMQAVSTNPRRKFLEQNFHSLRCCADTGIVVASVLDHLVDDRIGMIRVVMVED